MATAHGQLMVELEEKVVQTLLLTMPVLSIGRAPECGITLEGHLVSRRHAELRMSERGLMLTDLGSANGTYIAGNRLLPQQPQLLTYGTKFAIGPYTLTYNAVNPVAPVPDDEPVAVIDVPVMHKQELTALPTMVAMTFPSAAAGIPQRIKPKPRVSTDDEESLYLHSLPDIFQDNDFLRRFLLIFEDIWEPLERRQDHIEMYFDPRTCPETFLPWLASWLGLIFSAQWPEARRRRLLAEAMDLYRWRGTRKGLIQMIEVCTGFTPVISDVPGQPFVFRITISALAGRDAPDKNLIEELIQMHKPAHAGYILEVKA